MFFTQYYLDCLSQASYLIGDETTGRRSSSTRAATSRSTSTDAEAHGLHHRRASSTPTSTPTSSPGTSSSRRRPAPGSATARRGERGVPGPPPRRRRTHRLGDVALEIMETPGHTPESISVLVYEHAGDEVPYGVLTGDALFIGDVGRPDLLASIGVTADELGRMLYDIVQHKLMAPARRRSGSSPPTAPARPAARTSPPSGSRRSASSGPPTTPASR